MKRYKENKKKSRKEFTKNALKTKSINSSSAPMRGGYRI